MLSGSPGEPSVSNHNQKALQYLLAFALAVLALLVRVVFHPVLGDLAPYVTFFVAGTVSAGLWGAGAGSITIGAGFFFAGFFLSAGGWVRIVEPTDRQGGGRFMDSWS